MSAAANLITSYSRKLPRIEWIDAKGSVEHGPGNPLDQLPGAA
jgi:hypothetical protein